METTNESTILKNMAHQNPSISNPRTIFEAINTIAALITSRKNPRVKTVIGSVKNINTGFTKTLRKDRIIARKIAVHALSTDTCGISLVTSKMAIAVEMILARNLMSGKNNAYMLTLKINAD